MRRHVSLYWGPTGTGKSHRAFQELGMDAYPKDPGTKWWSGYRGESCCVIDEYRGGIDIRDILRWTDKYPVLIEPKHGYVPLKVSRFIFTSNLPIDRWYPELDAYSLDALKRRFDVIEELSVPYVELRPATPVIDAHEVRIQEFIDLTQE